MLASVGARRRWFFREEAEPAPSDEPIVHSMLGSLASRSHESPADGNTPARGESAASDEPIVHSMLGSLASRSHESPADEKTPARDGPAASYEPIVHSMLGLDPSAGGPPEWFARVGVSGRDESEDRDEPIRGAFDPLAGDAEPGPSEEPEQRFLPFVDSAVTARTRKPSASAVKPAIVHSTLAELAGLEHHASRAFPIERAILISLCAHLLIVILLIVVPARTPASQPNLIDALAAAMTPPKDESPIPINFKDLPGAPRENPKRSVLSDADRRAGGGDPARPKADTPFVPRAPGIEGLAPGPRAPRVPGAPAQAQARPAQAQPRREAEQRAALETSDPSAQRKASEFPTDMRPSLSNGPREVTKLAGLDAAIREAARGTVGGEGGAPMANEEGGFVDVGGVSFETSWYDWGPYAAEMLRRIKLHWRISRDLLILQQNGTTQIAFSIMADGSVADVRIQRPSTVPPYTHAAMQAIIESDPFRPLPKDLLRLVPGKDRERIVINFIYFPTEEELNGRREPR